MATRAAGSKRAARTSDTAQSVEAAAVLLREAAQWSARKLEGLNLTPAGWAMRLREGASIYYNLSTRSRSAWNGRNSFQFPVETQQHIRNARQGALIASRIEGGAPPVGLLCRAAHQAQPCGGIDAAEALEVALKASARRIRRYGMAREDASPYAKRLRQIA